MFAARSQQPQQLQQPPSRNSRNQPKNPLLHNSCTSRNGLCYTPAATAFVAQQLQQP